MSKGFRLSKKTGSFKLQLALSCKWWEADGWHFFTSDQYATLVCLPLPPSVISLVVEQPILGHMQGYHCMQHHTGSIVHMLSCTAGPFYKTYCWKQNGMSESLFIYCFLPHAFSQEAIGKGLVVEICKETKWQKKGTSREWYWEKISPHLSTDFTYTDDDLLQLYFPHWLYLAVVAFGKKNT